MSKEKESEFKKDRDYKEELDHDKFKSRKKNYSSKHKGGTKKEMRKGKYNDPAWYYTDASVAQGFAAFPYNRPTGTDLRVFRDASNVTESAPSVACIDYVPAYGSVLDASNAINVAARALFSNIRKTNAGGTNYEAVDLMQYILAMDQVYTFTHYIRTLLKLCRTYHTMNRTIPTIVLAANYIDVNAEIGVFASNVARFNLVIHKINQQFAVPANLTLFKRRAYIQNSIFSDSSSIEGQLYMFVPKAIYRYQGFVRDDGGALAPEFLRSNGTGYEQITTISDLIDQLTEMVDELIANQDIAIMVGDIYKKLEGELFSLSPYSIDETVDFVFDENVLAQIENMQFVGGFDSLMPIDDATPLQSGGQIPIIFQEKGLIKTKWEPVFSATTTDLAIQPIAWSSQAARDQLESKTIINSHKDNPTWEDNLEYTRLMEAIAFNGPAANGDRVLYFGSEKILSVRYIVKGNSNMSTSSEVIQHLPVLGVQSAWYMVLQKSSFLVWNTYATSPSSPIDVSGIRQSINSIASFYVARSNFDWCPRLYVYVLKSGSLMNGDTYQTIGVDADLKKVCVIDNTNIIGTHTCALMALINIAYARISK